jgi:uncharacterized protein YjbI with pentapeptide repeats
MAGSRHRHRRAEELVAAVTDDAHQDPELTALAAAAEAVLADLRSMALAIRALVGPVGPDLYGADLAGADLASANLAGADLARARLAGADLARADLTRARLVSADLQGTDLTRAGLVGANLAGAILCGANLYGANLIRANLYNADLAGADLREVTLTRVNLTGADLHEATLTRADLYAADLTNADLRDASLRDAKLAQVLWSSGTSWPKDKAPLIQVRSEELRRGVWRIADTNLDDSGRWRDQLLIVLHVNVRDPHQRHDLPAHRHDRPPDPSASSWSKVAT